MFDIYIFLSNKFKNKTRLEKCCIYCYFMWNRDLTMMMKIINRYSMKNTEHFMD